MTAYEKMIRKELRLWEIEMLSPATTTSKLAKGIQNKVNGLIPEKAHKIITEAIKQMVKAVLFGSEKISADPLRNASLKARDQKAQDKTDFYKTIAMASGWGTGSGGLLLGLADFPILLSIKMKFLYEIAAIYGYDVRNFKERLFVLYVFQLAFSGGEKRQAAYRIVADWDKYQQTLPDKEDVFDWRSFQQEYRDYIDLAKLLQLVPVIGAVVGAYANVKLLRQLSQVAMHAYQKRILLAAEVKAEIQKAKC